MVLSPSIEQRVRGFLGQPPEGPAALRLCVVGHLEQVRAAAEASAFVDRTAAERVARSCLALLDGWWQLAPAHRSWVQAVCLYFVAPHDAEDEGSILGFDDDLEVLAWVLARMGEPERC